MKILKLMLFLAVSLPSAADDKRLASVKSICIGRIGEIGSEESIEFVRFALRFELKKFGFTVVDSAQTADAVLYMTGWSSWPNTAVLSLAVLKAADGENIWEKEFQSRGAFGRAQNLGRLLRKDIRLAAKK